MANKMLCAAALLLSIPASAQVIAPGRVIALPGILPTQAVHLPSVVPNLPLPVRIPDVPVLPVPTLPGVPVYRLNAPAAAAQPAVAAVYQAPVAVAYQGPVAVAAALPAAGFAGRVNEEKASDLKPGAPRQTIERVRKAFGLQGKKPEARRLQQMFDGTFEGDYKDNVVIVEEVEVPQTLPEHDLQREIGAVNPRR